MNENIKYIYIAISYAIIKRNYGVLENTQAIMS